MSAESRRKALAIADISSNVVDTGRRGGPKPGCDCVQCFGYCMYDSAKAERDTFQAIRGQAHAIPWGDYKPDFE